MTHGAAASSGAAGSRKSARQAGQLSPCGLPAQPARPGRARALAIEIVADMDHQVGVPGGRGAAIAGNGQAFGSRQSCVANRAMRQPVSPITTMRLTAPGASAARYRRGSAEPSLPAPAPRRPAPGTRIRHGARHYRDRRAVRRHRRTVRLRRDDRPHRKRPAGRQLDPRRHRLRLAVPMPAASQTRGNRNRQILIIASIPRPRDRRSFPVFLSATRREGTR